MANSIRNIIFDMGGVLIDLDRDACVAAFGTIGFPQAEELLNPYRQKGVFAELEMGRISPERFYDYIREQTGNDIPDAGIAATLNKFLTGLPAYKLDMLLRLRERFKVYMLSNTNAVMMPYIKAELFTQRGLAFEDYFDKAFLSYEMNALKPDEAIFLKMMESGNIVPGESLFLDDGKANIETAKKLGFDTYLTTPREDYRRIFSGL